MRIRNTKPEFWRSKRVAERLPNWEHRLVLKALESYVDDNGVGKDDIALIAADCFSQDVALDPSGTFRKLQEASSHLFEAGFLHRYTVDGERLLYISWWESTQYVQKPKPGRLPRPDGTFDYNESKIGEPDRTFPETSGSFQPVSGNQGIRESGYVAPQQQAPSPDDGFDQWWGHYPKKVQKGEARKAWPKALALTDTATLIAGAKGYAEWCEAVGRERQYIKNPATWLNGEAWGNTDELGTPAQSPSRPSAWDYGPEAYMHPEERELERQRANATGGST